MNNKDIIDGGFLQSEHWKNFQKKLGRNVVEIEDDDAKALMIEYKLPVVGSYFFVPRGPVRKFPISNFQFPNKTQNPKLEMQTLFEQIVSLAKDNNIGWVRVEPQREEDLKMIRDYCKQAGLVIQKSKKNHEPAETLMLDLEQTEDELLAKMKQKTRYNIRLAEKRGVEIFTSRKDEDIEKFCELTEETARRDGIIAHPRGYYKLMIKEVPENVLKLYFAKYQGKIIAANMMIFFGEVATYLHGSSANDSRNVMAPYLLQWQAIKDAKALGFKKYDFGGTKIKVENQKSGKSWGGITRFKLGFCPNNEQITFPGCYDIILDRKRHYLYRVIQKVKDILK